MDVVAIPEANSFFRIIPSSKGLILHPVEKDEAAFKLCRIEDKTAVKGGRLQLNLHDGSNVILKADVEGAAYETLDVLKVSLPKRDALDHLKIEEGAFAIAIGGENIGRYGRIIKIERKSGERRDFLTTIENDHGRSFNTILDYVFVIGREKPLISLPEVS